MKQNRKNRIQILPGLLLAGGLLLTGCAVGTDTWYARVAADDLSRHDTGGMPFDFSGAGNREYSCTLPAWNDKGEQTELTFGSDDPIEDGTWLQIETQALRGVMSWKTLPEEEVPAIARTEIQKDGA